jgi:hypothetical protein
MQVAHDDVATHTLAPLPFIRSEKNNTSHNEVNMNSPGKNET